MRKWLTFSCVALFLASREANAGAPPKPEEPLKIAAPTEEEKKAELAKETPQQKARRAELAAMKNARIAFNANLGEKNANVIFLVNPDGSGMKRLTAEGVSESYPHLSFDGKRLLFERTETLSAEEQKKIPCDATFPFNKEGRARAGKPAGYIWVSDLDGGNAQRLCQGRHLVYVHAEQQKGVKSWTLKTKQDLYVCRFPPDGVSVRITWTNAACQHPNWRNVAQ